MRRIPKLIAVLTVALTSAWFATPSAEAAPQVALQVLGQNGDFTTLSSSATSNSPRGVVVDPQRHRLFVANSNLNKVLIYNLDVNNRLSDETVDFTLGDGSATGHANTFNGPTSVALDVNKNRLFVSDVANRRVLVFELNSLATLMNASWVIGQSSLTTSTNRSDAADTLSSPKGLTYDERTGFLYVANSRRVSAFDTTNLTNGMDATYVFGQPNFTSNAGGSGANGMVDPRSVEVDSYAKRLYVGDSYLNRVLIFDLSAPNTGMNASLVIGAPDFNSGFSGVSEQTISNPSGIEVTGGHVYISDTNNNRVLSFPIPTSNGASATRVFGQPNFSANAAGTTATSLRAPLGLAVDTFSNRLYIADTNNNRVMAFNPMSLPTDATVGVSVDPTMSFTVAPRALQCGLQSAVDTVFKYIAPASASSIDLGNINSSTVAQGAHDLSVGANASGGVKVYVRGSQPSNNLRNSVTTTAFTDGATPASGVASFSYTTNDTNSLPGTWKALSLSGVQVASSLTQGFSGQCIGFSASAAPETPAGTYQAVVYYTAVPTY